MCCDRCSAASQELRSCSLNGKIACRVQHRSSMGVAFDSFIHTIVLDKIMIVSGVDYIKEVLFLGMAAGGDTAIMKTDKDTVESVVWNDITYTRESDDVVLDVDDGGHSEAWNKTMSERAILWSAVVKTGYLSSDLRRAVVDTKTAEPKLPVKGVYFLNKKPAENATAFKNLKAERNKWIGMLSRNQQDIVRYEDMDCFTVDTIKHVRHVFEASFVDTRTELQNVSSVETVVQERNDLLADFPAAIQKRNELVPAWNSTHKDAKRHLLAITPKIKQWSDGLIDTANFNKNGGVPTNVLQFKRYVSERDALYNELHQISDEIVEMTVPAAAALTAAGAKDAGEGVKLGGLPGDAKALVPPDVPSLAGPKWDNIPAVKDANEAGAPPPPVKSAGPPPEAPKPQTWGDKAKAMVGLGPKSAAGVKEDSPGPPPAAASNAVPVSTAKRGGPAAQSPATVATVASYTPGALPVPSGVAPNSERTDTPAAASHISEIVEDVAHSEHVDAPPQSVLQVVRPQHTGQSGGGVSDDEFNEIVDDSALAQVKTELRRTIAALEASKDVNKKNLAIFDRLAQHVGKTAETTVESQVLKLVAFEKSVRVLVEGDTTLTQDQMVEAIEKHIAEKPALIAEIRHEIAKVDPARDVACKDDVVKAVRSYGEEAAEVFRLCSHVTAVTDHGGLILHIQTQVKAMESLTAKYKHNLAEMNRIAEAVNDKETQDSAQIIAHIHYHKRLLKAICGVVDCGEDAVLDSVQKLTTTYKTFEDQIAKLIPAEIVMDQDGNVLSVIDRVDAWHHDTAAIKGAAVAGDVGEVVGKIAILHKSIETLTHAASAGGGDVTTNHAAIVKLLHDQIAASDGEFAKSQKSLTEAHFAKLEAERLQLASDAKLGPLQVELAHLREALDDACEDLDAAREPMKPFVMNTRMVSLLNDLHDVLHINFAKNTHHDQGRILKEITRTIFNAFHDDRKVDAVRQLMYGMMIEFEIDITDTKLHEAAVASRAYVARLCGGGMHGPHAGGEDVDEDDERWRSSMRRLGDGEGAEEDVGIYERTSRRPRAEVVDGEDEASRRRTGALWAGRRAEDIDGGREDARVVDTSWRLPEPRTYHADTSQRRPRTRAGEAHMECVSNWLHDLSQMIEPGSP